MSDKLAAIVPQKVGGDPSTLIGYLSHISKQGSAGSGA